MKTLLPLMASAIVLATSSIAFAATDSTTVQINVTEGAYVTLKGTALNSVNDFLTTDIGVGNSLALGDMGFDSNVTGTCSLEFASANNYQLNHSVSGDKLVDYEITYGTTNPAISSTTPNTITQDCADDTLSPLAWAATTPIVGPTASGTYSDTVTITVTTP